MIKFVSGLMMRDSLGHCATEVLNLSAEPLGKVRSWIPHDLRAEKIVFLPDACPGKSPLPTGTVVLTQQENWRQFAVSDCGCGMRLLRSSVPVGDLDLLRWDQLASRLQANKGGLGDLGGGNHFLDALAPYENGPLHFLVHTGSRNESGHVDKFVDQPAAFDREFDRVVHWATDNRSKIHEEIEAIFGGTDLILDTPHNTYEQVDDKTVIIRKGAIRALPGDFAVIPSSMSGDIVLVRATAAVTEILNSLSHGTGRLISRSGCKPLADTFDFSRLRETILIPSCVQDASLRTEGPYAYRDLDACLALLAGYVEMVARFSVVGYMGHL